MRTGRPKKEIDLDEFEKLCRMQCTEEEIANFFDMTRDTLIERVKDNYEGQSFSTVYKQFADEGKISLRRAQFQKALSGNVAMLIWLGKQILNQKEKTEQEVLFDGDFNVNTTVGEHIESIARSLSIPLS